MRFRPLRTTPLIWDIIGKESLIKLFARIIVAAHGRPSPHLFREIVPCLGTPEACGPFHAKQLFFI
jgi:hypothetical protein